MNNTTNTPLNDGAELGGNISVTAPTPTALTITAYDRDRFLSALYAVMFRNFNKFLESQPVVLTLLGANVLRIKDKGTNIAVNNFINAMRELNVFLATLAQKQGIYGELEEFLNSIPLECEVIE